MASMNFRKVVLAIASNLFMVVTLSAQDNGSCKIQITTPKNGDPVTTSGEVRGSASIPPGMFLWIFAQREGLAKWWPQSGGAARVRTGERVVHTVYGDERDPAKDAGANFVITAVVVDQKGHDEIVKYVQKSESEN